MPLAHVPWSQHLAVWALTAAPFPAEAGDHRRLVEAVSGEGSRQWKMAQLGPMWLWAPPPGQRGVLFSRSKKLLDLPLTPKVSGGSWGQQVTQLAQQLQAP